MYDINFDNLKKGRKEYLIFLIIGFISFVLLMTMTVSNIVKWNSLDSHVLSTSVSIRETTGDDNFTRYTATYHYNVDGNDYSCSTMTRTNYFPSQKNKVVYYNSASPEVCMPKSSKISNFLMLLFWIIPALFLFASVPNILEINGRIKIIKELNKKGKLIKNIPYKLEKTGKVINDIPIYRVVVNYVLKSGDIVALYGDDRYDNIFCDSDRMVDLIIDEENPGNYFIDFEINRLSGNLPQDYYSKKTDNLNIQE